MGKTVLFVESRKEITLNLRRWQIQAKTSQKKNELSMGNWKLMVRSFLFTFSLFFFKEKLQQFSAHTSSNSGWFQFSVNSMRTETACPPIWHLSWSEKVYNYIDSSTRKLAPHHQCSCFRDFEHCNTVPLLHNSLLYSHRVLCLSLTEA